MKRKQHRLARPMPGRVRLGPKGPRLPQPWQVGATAETESMPALDASSVNAGKRSVGAESFAGLQVSR